MTRMKWKVNKRMALWTVLFALVAVPTGMFLLRAVEGGFLAEGFFLISLSWILLFFLVAKLVDWLTKSDLADE